MKYQDLTLEEYKKAKYAVYKKWINKQKEAGKYDISIVCSLCGNKKFKNKYTHMKSKKHINNSTKMV